MNDKVTSFDTINNQTVKFSGFVKQTRIILWKNFLLYKANKSGIVCEILFVSFAFILLLFAYNLDVNKVKGTHNRPMDLFESTDGWITSLHTNIFKKEVFYYPNNSFVLDLLQESLSLAKIYDFIPLNESSPTSLNYTMFNETFVIVSFPASYQSIEDVKDSLNYTIYSFESGLVDSFKTDLILTDPKVYLYESSPESVCQKKNEILNSQVQSQDSYKAFNIIKNSIDQVIMNRLLNRDHYKFQYKIKKFELNCPPYEEEYLKTYFKFFIPLVVCVSYMVTFIINVSSIIVEKQTKVKDYLKLVGVRSSVITFCWTVKSFLIYFLLCTFITFSLKHKFNQYSIMNYTSTLVLFLNFFIYSIEVICLSILVGQFFNKIFVAKIVSIVFWFLTLTDFYLPSYSIYKYFFCVFPNLSLTYSFQFIYQYERSSINLTLDRIFRNLFDDVLNLGTIWISMLCWSFVFVFLTCYFEYTGEYGIMSRLRNRNSHEVTGRDEKDEDMVGEDTKFINDAFEKEDPLMKATVKLKKLTKKFRTGFVDKTVVDNVTINFYENQITGFLGHNGAGKSTVTYILCGVYAPTSGTAKILNKDIRFDLNTIRSSIGYCPQINILYDELTVDQHLDMVCSIKGFESKDVKNEVERVSTFVGLREHSKKKAKQLSGGMKRRLSFAMSLIGDARVIILDEPSSGLDPLNRRELWNLIKTYKKNRTIILTTHYMEEADALSDRIAIINHGKIKCYGTPLFLKERFGYGYRLTITKAENFNPDELDRIFNSVLGCSPIIDTNVARELTIVIPIEIKNKLSNLLVNIENYKSQIGILNYGISSSTVEEVFLKLGDINADEHDPASHLKQDTDLKPLENVKKNRGLKLNLQQLGALWLKRFRTLASRRLIFASTLLAPSLILLLCLYVIPSASNLAINKFDNYFNIKTLPHIRLDFDLYPIKQTILYKIDSDELSADKTSRFENVLRNYFSTRYANKHRLVRLDSHSNQTIDKFIYQKRTGDLRNLVLDYFLAFDVVFKNSELSNVIIYYSSMAYHLLPVGLNEINGVILSYVTNQTIKSINTVNWPLVRKTDSDMIKFLSTMTQYNLNQENIFSCVQVVPFSVLDSLLCLIVAFLVGLMSIHQVRERTNGSKKLQLISGVGKITYWTSNYLFDLSVCVINITLMLCVLILAQKFLITDNSNDLVILLKTSPGKQLFYLGVSLTLGSLTWISLSYAWSFLFKSDILAFAILFILLGLTVLIDMILFIVSVIMKNVSQSPDEDSSLRIQTIIRQLMVIMFPNLNVKQTVYNLKLQNSELCKTILNSHFAFNYSLDSRGFELDEPGIGMNLIFNLIAMILFILLIILTETRFGFDSFSRIYNGLESCIKEIFYPGSSKPISLNTQIEEDVHQESMRISSESLSNLSGSEPILVKKLYREFRKGRARPFYAVENLNFGVQECECFGLLGLNGAGKTTTIEILTGQMAATKGDAYLNGYNVANHTNKAIRNLGLCPQFDYLPEFLTVKQTLYLYANIRGVRGDCLNSLVKLFISSFQLDEFADKYVQNLSGGTKRKLSSAIAIIGRPKTIILDEPTAGMDPAARRHLWNIIKAVRQMKTTVLLTTHSMEECEALCTKLGIMVSGQFKCYGNIQNIKSKFGKGYTLILKLNKPLQTDEQDPVNNGQEIIEKLNKLEKFISDRIKNAILKDKQNQTLFYQILFNIDATPRSESKVENELTTLTQPTTIAQIFQLIEENKALLDLETYSLSQTTLEQIFLSFTSDGVRNSVGMIKNDDEQINQTKRHVSIRL